jgi:internalin A
MTSTRNTSRAASLCGVVIIAALGCGAIITRAIAQGNDASESQAINSIKRLGGSVQRDSRAPGRPVIGVGFSGTDVTDDDLAILRNLPRLEILTLSRTAVSDSGLKHLGGLKNLKQLHLPARTTDEGLANLVGLSKLQLLDILDSQVTDAGLEYLKGLANLRVVLLNGTQVTAAGVRDLQRALPKARIGH